MTTPGRNTGVQMADVIGDPIEQSKSPAIHRFWLDRLGLRGLYLPKRVPPGDLEQYLFHANLDGDWRGCNVTMPHKQTILSHLKRLDPHARRIGAVNTVVRPRHDSACGYNTDVSGFLEPLRDRLATRHLFRMARVLGTGGAARAVVAGLADHGFTLVLAGRDPAKAQALLDELAPHGEHHAVHLDQFSEPTDFAFDDRAGCLDLVVNASPLGMRGQPPLVFDWSHAPPGSIAYDIVTDPVDTPFLRDARAAGFATIDGLAMLIGQAALAFEMFFGHPAPREHDGELRALLTG